jgi:NTE family protein
VKTAEKYIDYNKLQPNGNPSARLIITAVNVLTAEPLIFDSSKQQITSKHLLAATGYPTYYFPWMEVLEGIYAWDGSLLSNTPLDLQPLMIFFLRITPFSKSIYEKQFKSLSLL